MVHLSAYGFRNSASRWMAGPIRAAATPIAIAQPNSAPVGWLKPGMPGRASENVPSPVRLSRPMKMSEPIPAASSPGSSTTPSIGPPSPDASISKNAPVRGDPSSVLTAAKAPGDTQHPGRLVRHIAPPGQPDDQGGQPAAERDQRHLRAEHGAEDQRRQRRQDDAGQLDRGRRRMHGESARR